MASPDDINVMFKLIALSKRRGIVFPASEIYGGINGFWDYGPLGTALKNNIRDNWWHSMVTCPPDGPHGHPLQILGLDSAIIQNPSVWKASGHLDGFHDEMVDCRETKGRYRADHLLCAPLVVTPDVAPMPEQIGWASVVDGEDAQERLSKRFTELGRKLGQKFSDRDIAQAITYSALPVEDRSRVFGPSASAAGTLTEPRAFNLMLKSSVGALQGSDSTVYLRPETAQGIFINFKNVADSSRARIPFGIAQVGKSFRNEITPRNYIFRSREFEQMEMEWFCEPETSEMWHEYWVNQRLAWWEALGVKTNNLQLRPHDKNELAHYSKACTDVEYRYPFSHGGFGELEGIAHRGDFDLNQHQTHSKTKLKYLDQAAGKAYMPHVIEPAAGLTRAVLAVLCDAYHYDESRPSTETLMLPAHLAPVKIGVFPLTNKDGMPEMAELIEQHLRQCHVTQLDTKQSIGKRYARMDEIGTPFCITVDNQSVSDGSVTVRDRDTCAQQRISAENIESYMNDSLRGQGQTPLATKIRNKLTLG